jgi:hypothetical protein
MKKENLARRFDSHHHDNAKTLPARAPSLTAYLPRLQFFTDNSRVCIGVSLVDSRAQDIHTS